MIFAPRTSTAEFGASTLASTRHRLRFSQRELERRCDLHAGVISAVERGRQYAYPKLRARVTAAFCDETGEPFDVVHDRAFPDYSSAEALERLEGAP